MKKVNFKIKFGGDYVSYQEVDAWGYEYRGFKIHHPHDADENRAYVQKRSKFFGWFVTGDAGYKINPNHINLKNLDAAKRFIDTTIDGGIHPAITREEYTKYLDQYHAAVAKYQAS